MNSNNGVRLSCMMKYSAEGKLVGRDILFHTEQENIDLCFGLLGDFRQKFNKNPSLLPEATAVQEPKLQTAVKTTEPETTPFCPRCKVPMRRMQNKFKPNSFWFACPRFSTFGCLEKITV